LSTPINPPFTLEVLVNTDLVYAGFSVNKLIEVFELDADGSRIASIRCFEDPDVADAFEESNSHYGQRTVYVLTNGTVVLLLEIESQLSMADEEAIAARLKQEALNGLKPAVRKLLGLNK
jgi:hypothetical protein